MTVKLNVPPAKGRHGAAADCMTLTPNAHRLVFKGDKSSFAEQDEHLCLRCGHSFSDRTPTHHGGEHCAFDPYAKGTAT